MSAIGEGAVASDATAADAFQEVHATETMRTSTLGLCPPDILHPRPEFVGDGWAGTPRSRTSGSVGTAVAAYPAVVDRVHQDAAVARRFEAGLGGELLGARGSQRIALEQTHGAGDGGRVDLERVGGSEDRRNPNGAWPPGSFSWSNLAA